MPAMHWNFEQFAELVQAPKLIVYQRFKGTDIKKIEAFALPLLRDKPRQEGQEGCLCLTPGGRRGDDGIGILVEEQGDCLFLDIPKLAPLFLPDPALDRTSQKLKTR